MSLLILEFATINWHFVFDNTLFLFYIIKSRIISFIDQDRQFYCHVLIVISITLVINYYAMAIYRSWGMKLAA